MASEDKSDFKHCPAFCGWYHLLVLVVDWKRDACEVSKDSLLVYMMRICVKLPKGTAEQSWFSGHILLCWVMRWHRCLFLFCFFLSLLLVLSFVYCGLKKRKEKNYFVVYDLLDWLKMYVIMLLKTLRQGGIWLEEGWIPPCTATISTQYCSRHHGSS